MNTKKMYPMYPTMREEREMGKYAHDLEVNARAEREAALCAKCGEPLSLPMPGFEDQTVTDACYCVGCRPEEDKQGVLRLEGEK